MSLLHGVGDFFALDIGTNSIRMIQLSGNIEKGWVLEKFAYVPIDPKLTKDDSDAGRRRLGEIILGARQQAGIKTKNIAVGMPARKTYTAIIEVPNATISQGLQMQQMQLLSMIQKIYPQIDECVFKINPDFKLS